jgi:hypothetical protein
VPPGNSFPTKTRRDRRISIFSAAVNSATVGILRRFAGSGDPLGSLSLFPKKPWCVANHTGLFFSAGDHRSSPALPCPALPCVTVRHAGRLPLPHHRADAWVSAFPCTLPGVLPSPHSCLHCLTRISLSVGALPQVVPP